MSAKGPVRGLDPTRELLGPDKRRTLNGSGERLSVHSIC